MKEKSIKSQVTEICLKVKNASNFTAILSENQKNEILLEAARNIEKNAAQIIAQNQKDVDLAKKNNMDKAKLDRLVLNEDRLKSIVQAIRDVVKLADPVGKITYDVKRENGLKIKRITTPIGVLMAIFESRPNVTSDIAALALKAGNAVILRCGSDSINSSKALASCYSDALKKFGVDENAIYLVAQTNREYVKNLLKMEKYIDVVVPRGGKSLIEAVMKESKIPVFRHLDGNCHTYLHEKADLQKARKIVFNAKLRRTGVCGATESLLIDKKIAQEFLPRIVDDLIKEGCEIRGDKASQKIDSRIKAATNQDFYTEYLDKILSVKIVKDCFEAINHINKFGSSHTESIITEDQNTVKEFFANVHSAIVMHNASTQFADGGEFGLGAEVGIATGKLHARGPVGLEQLVTYKYIVDADCAIRK